MKKKSKTIKKAGAKCLAHTDITVVIDRSGSMSSLSGSTIEGFNKFLAEQQAVEGEASLTLMLFDHEFLTVSDGVDLAEAKPLDHLTYVPRGTTALLDAIGQSVGKAERRLKVGSKPVVLIITDGFENASKEYSRQNIFNTITRLKALGWEFVFLGANQDAIRVGQDYGMNAANSMTYAGNSAGTQSAYQATSTNLSAMRCCSVQDMAFTAADKKAQQEAGV